MRPSFHPRLINGAFDDPGLFIAFLFQKRAFLFDVGDLGAFPTRELLKVTHIFVTHTHMDHFIGFDRVLRLFLGREKVLCLFGPPGFFDNVEGKLRAYSWNLVEDYETQLVVKALEVHPGKILAKSYLCRDGFSAEGAVQESPSGGVLLNEPGFQVEAALLDHKIPCLGLTLRERFHVNVMKDRLQALGLPVGPWLKDLKEALYDGRGEDAPIRVPCERQPDRTHSLGFLAARLVRITPGQKISYITDVAYHPENEKRILTLVADTDHLFIEAAFLEKHRKIAAAKHHLTAWQAGTLARKAGVRKVTVFHFSPRYQGSGHLLEQEAQAAFRGD